LQHFNLYLRRTTDLQGYCSGLLKKTSQMSKTVFFLRLSGGSHCRGEQMKYILMMQFGIADWKKGNITNWQPEEVKKNMDYLIALNNELVASGEMVQTEGLGGPETMKFIRAAPGAPPVVTDGPFPESKEFLAGFWIVDVESAQRAYEIASRISALPGPGGNPANLPIEVRPVMKHSGSEHGV